MPNPRRKIKSRAGCQTCKRRRVKCDETLPHCVRCSKLGLDCPGYKKDVKWSDKYEMLRDDEAGSPGHRRSDSNWFTEGAASFESALASENIRSNAESDSVVDRPVTFQGRRETAAESLHRSLSVSRVAQPSYKPLQEGQQTPIAEVLGTSENSIAHCHLGMHDIYQGDPYYAPLVHLESPTERLLRHYFSRVCSILSAFDSPQNPFRYLVNELMPSYPALLHSVLAMSAAHLHQHEKKRAAYSLEHRSQAISCLVTHISELETAEATGVSCTSSTTALLLGTIILGMTSTWHEVSSLDLIHLHGARALFKRWMVDTRAQYVGPSPLNPQASFIVGAMAYWEALASFHIDQDMSEVDYLWPVCELGHSLVQQPNPLSGVSTPLFIYLAKVGTMSRQLSLLRRLATVSSTVRYKGDLYYLLLRKAREISQTVCAYPVPLGDRVRETGDASTPVQHLQTITQVYILSITLEIYRLFSEMLQAGDSTRTKEYYADQFLSTPRTQTLLISLAVNILTLLSSIPKTSRTKAIQLLPLIIAGSALQGAREAVPTMMPLDILVPGDAIMSLFSNEAIVFHWRKMTIDMIASLHLYVGLDSVDHAKRIVEGVWMRADSHSGTLYADECSQIVSWTDIMTEEKLQTFLG